MLEVSGETGGGVRGEGDVGGEGDAAEIRIVAIVALNSDENVGNYRLWYVTNDVNWRWWPLGEGLRVPVKMT